MLDDFKLQLLKVYLQFYQFYLEEIYSINLKTKDYEIN